MYNTLPNDNLSNLKKNDSDHIKLQQNVEFYFISTCTKFIVSTVAHTIYRSSTLYQMLQKETISWGRMFNPFPNKPWFLRIRIMSLLKTLWEKEKLLVTSNFSFSLSVFLPVWITCFSFHQAQNCRLQTLSFWKCLIHVFVVWERVTKRQYVQIENICGWHLNCSKLRISSLFRLYKVHCQYCSRTTLLKCYRKRQICRGKMFKTICSN